MKKIVLLVLALRRATWLRSRAMPGKRDPMICLNGECYVTFYNKPPW